MITQEYYGDANTLTSRELDHWLGKDVVFKSPTSWGIVKITRKAKSILITTENRIAVKVRFNGSIFIIPSWDIVSINGLKNRHYDKHNFTSFRRAFKKRFNPKRLDYRRSTRGV